MTWLQSQFDKILITSMALVMCALTFTTNDKLTAFALTTAGSCIGCLLTLVTARHSAPPEPTSSTSITTTETTTPAQKP